MNQEEHIGKIFLFTAIMEEGFVPEMVQSKIPGDHILNNWDVDNTTNAMNQTLRNFIAGSIIGEIWSFGSGEELMRIQ